MSEYFEIRYSELTDKFYLNPNEKFISICFENLSNLELIDLCLEKWKLVYETGKIVSLGGAYSCALCRKYHAPRNWQGNCGECPIFLKTGAKICGDTPNYKIECDEYNNEEEFLELVKQEIEFLEELKKDLINENNL